MAIDEYRDVIHRCFRCGFCKMTYEYSWVGFNCPMYHRFRLETCSPGGLMWLTRGALITGDLEWSERLSNILYACTMCGNCSEQCRFEFGEDLVNIFRSVRETAVDDQRPLPALVGKFMENVSLYGNPYRELRETRGDWAKGSGIRGYQKGDEHLLFVGCAGSYDPVGQRAAKALGALLLKSGLSFGILGEREDCDGNEVRMLGERGLFEHQRDRNLQTFRELGVKKIVTLSPHAYDAIKNHYPPEFEVSHYTALLQQLAKDGRLKLKGRGGQKITYHDPCFLGRHNKEYDTPRELLQAVPGLELVEMARSGKNAFCCGGGGGNFYTGISARGKEQASVARVREAVETGAGVLATACPVCLVMLQDAVKSDDLEERIAVRDISEVLLESTA